MKSLTKKVLVGLVAGCCVIAGGRYGLRLANKKIEEKIAEYKQEDREWTRKNFEKSVSLEQLTNAFNSTYQVLNQTTYKTSNDILILGGPGNSVGSGILLKGNYFLTVKHIIEEDFQDQTHPDYGLVTFDNNELFITDKIASATIKKDRLEKVLAGKDLDYALFKLKGSQDLDNQDLQFYNRGLNLPDKIIPGMRSITVGFPIDNDRDIRLGNVSQTTSDLGVEHLTFKNSTAHGDSGGPVFVIKNGNLKLVAILRARIMEQDPDFPSLYHPTNINYGLKINSIVNDMKMQLESEELDEDTRKEVKNFLKLNL